MKKSVYLLVTVLIVGALYFGFKIYQERSGQSSSTKDSRTGLDGKVYYQFSELPKGIIAQSGDLQVKASEVENTAAMKSFKNKKRDILFAIIYRQFVSYAQEPVDTIEFSFKKVGRSPSAILNQYGVVEKYSTKIKFQAFNVGEGLARVDGKLITEQDVDYDNFIWASYDTAVFRYKLSAIDSILKEKLITAEAKKLKLSTQAYQEKYIYEKIDQNISEKSLNQYLQRYSMEDTERNRKAAKNRLIEARKQRGVDYILEQYVMTLPVKINLKAPQYKLKAKAEWTPVWGPSSGMSITLFSGTKNTQSVELLKGLVPLFEKYKNINFKYRPIFFKPDQIQNMTSQMHFCVWMHEKKSFWSYLSATAGDHKTAAEAMLYSKAEELDLDVEALKKCLVSQKYKEVVDYHLQYAQYLGIQVGPVLYVGGEVLYGTIPMDDVEKIIQRKLNLPTAGVW